MKSKNADAVVKFFIDLSNKDATKGITEVDKKSDVLAKKFNKAGKALTVGLTTPMVAFGTYAVKTATDFDKASNQIQSSLGLTTQEVKEYEEVMRNVYNANYGESYEDVANSIATVQKTLDGLNSEQLEKVTESALTLRDTFGIEVNESIRATKAMMDIFGTSSDEAMNLLAQGFQNGLNYSDEFIDNINEYSVQFGKLGLSAEDMFNIFQSGADAGAWNLDKIGDAVKEFSIRAIDGSETTIDGFTRLGMNANAMAQKFASGGDTAKKAFYEVIDAIGAMEDPVEQSIVGVDLFGTMWEDLGPEVVTQLGSIRDAYNQTNDSMQGLKDVKYDDLGSMLETLKRQFGDIALDVGNELMPTIQSFIGKIQELVTWFSNLDPETKTMIGNIAKIAVVVGPALILFSKMVSTVKDISSAFNTFGTAISNVTGKDSLLRKGLNSGINTLKDYVKYLKTGAIEAGKMALEAGKSAVQFIAQKSAMIATTVATKAAAAAQWLLNAAMSANPITLIIIAIVALMTILVVLWNKCEWFRDGVMTVINAVWSAIQAVGSFIMNIFTTVFNFIWSIVQAYVNFWITVWTTVFNIVSTVLTSIWNAIQSVFNFIWGIISSVINNIISAFRNVANIVKSVFTSVKNAISNLFSGVVNIIKAPINGLIGLINGVIKGLNKIKLPDWVPGVGGKGINIPLIPKLATGTNYIAREGLAYLHQGEAVVPKKYNPAVGGYGNYYQPNITIIANMDVNKFGKAFVKDIKTFSGGAKNSYNYGGSR